jgi:hypothetical protein
LQSALRVDSVDLNTDGVIVVAVRTDCMERQQVVLVVVMSVEVQDFEEAHEGTIATFLSVDLD